MLFGLEKELILKKFTFVNDMLVTNSGIIISKNGDFFECVKKRKTIINKNNSLFNLLDRTFNECLLKEQIKDFACDTLMPYLPSDREVLECGASLNDSLMPKILMRDKKMKVMLIYPHLDYDVCVKLGYTNVLAGEVLTEKRKLWTSNYFYSDEKSHDHPDFEWALEKVENVSFPSSSFLCLSRRCNIEKLVAQFPSAIFGYYGIKGSDSLNWQKDFYKKEIKSSLEEVEEEKDLEDGSKALIHLFIK